MTKNKKVLCIVLAGIIVFLTVAGILFYIFGYYGKKDFSLLKLPVNPHNYVDFKKTVHVAEKSSEIQKNCDTVGVSDEKYTIVYKKELPDFFENMKTGDVFCVYPDGSASESFFALGFCGKLTDIKENGDKYVVSFVMPELKEVFSDVYINTNVSGKPAVSSTAFYPNENVVDVQQTETYNIPKTLSLTSGQSEFLSASVNHKVTKTIEESVGYKFEEPKSESLLDDYTLICEKLKLKFDFEVANDEGSSFEASGDVTLEETAVKLVLDYHLDEATDTVQINDYSIGFITKQKVNLSFNAGQSYSLNDLDFDLSEKIQIIDVEDVTESEEGKVILGTYLIGLEAALPIFENDTNDVNYLSLGIAVQLTLTGTGEISLECDFEESGFAQIEVNSNGKNKHLIKGYDYPNPVKETRSPTEEEKASVPSVTSKMNGKAEFNIAFGGDIGVCILGMIPIKQANNFVEFEIVKKVNQQTSTNKKVDVINNNYLSDDSVDSLIISSNSYLKMHFGGKINFGNLKYKLGEMGGSIQLFKDVWYQSPPATGFSHSQCGFGGVFVGETYTDEEMKDAFNTYMKDTSQNSIVTYVKDSLFGSLINVAFNEFDLDFIDMASFLGESFENCKFNYFTSGIIYVRDPNNTVVASIVIGEDITNITGVHIGLSSSKIVQVYSAPDLSAEVHINIGSFVRSFFDIDWLKNTDLLCNTYYSCDSNETMNLIFCDNSLKMIVVT